MKKRFITSVILAASLTVSGCDLFQKDAYDFMDEVQSTGLNDESINGISLGDTSERWKRNLENQEKMRKANRFVI